MGNTMSSAYQTVGMCSLDTAAVTTPPSAATTCSLVQIFPVPDGATCGFLGYLSRPNRLRDWQIDASDSHPQFTCTKACWDDHTCMSSAYDPDMRQCALYASPVVDQVPRKSKSGVHFYEPACFTQNCEVNEVVGETDVQSYKDSPLADLRLRHCDLDETFQLTDPAADYDEHTYFPVTLPFPVRLYGASTDSLYMSINGYVSFNSPFVTHAEPHSLPHYTQMAKGSSFGMMPQVDGGLPENTVCGLWAEAVIDHTHTPIPSQSNTDHFASIVKQHSPFSEPVFRRDYDPIADQIKALDRDLEEEERQLKQIEHDKLAVKWMSESLDRQGMRYTVLGKPGERWVTFTWKTSRKGNPHALLDFDIVYYENFPGQWTIRYRSVGDDEPNAPESSASKRNTVGSQSTEASGIWLQYVSEKEPIADGMMLVLDSTSNTLRRRRRTLMQKTSSRGA